MIDHHLTITLDLDPAGHHFQRGTSTPGAAATGGRGPQCGAARGKRWEQRGGDVEVGAWALAFLHRITGFLSVAFGDGDGS